MRRIIGPVRDVRGPQGKGDIGQKLCSRHRPRAQGGQVAGVLLAVDGGHTPRPAGRHQGRQRQLGGIGAVRKHRFAEHHAAQADEVQAADQLAVHPGLDAVRAPEPVPGAVGLHHAGHDPGAVLAVARCAGAGLHHAAEVAVEDDLAARRAQEGLQRLAQRALQLEGGHRQHHARVRAPPQHRLAGPEPGEQALAVGLFQPRRVQPAAGGHQAGQLLRHAAGRRQRALVVDPVDQGLRCVQRRFSVRQRKLNSSADMSARCPLSAAPPWPPSMFS